MWTPSLHEASHIFFVQSLYMVRGIACQDMAAGLLHV